MKYIDFNLALKKAKTYPQQIHNDIKQYNYMGKLQCSNFLLKQYLKEKDKYFIIGALYILWPSYDLAITAIKDCIHTYADGRDIHFIPGLLSKYEFNLQYHEYCKIEEQFPYTTQLLEETNRHPSILYEVIQQIAKMDVGKFGDWAFNIINILKNTYEQNKILDDKQIILSVFTMLNRIYSNNYCDKQYIIDFCNWCALKNEFKLYLLEIKKCGGLDI